LANDKQHERAVEPHVSGGVIRRFWNGIGTVGGVLSLSNIVEQWLGDFFRWKSLIGSTIDTYQSIIESILSLFFGWTSIQIPVWIVDWLIFGIIINTSFALSINPTVSISMKDRLMFGVLTITLWPYLLARLARRTLRGENVFAFWAMLGVILASIILLLAINSQIESL